MVRTQILDLIGLSLAESIGGRPASSTTRSLALFRLKAAIDSGLTDPNLKSEDMVRTQILDLIGLSLAESIGGRPASSTTRSLALFRLKAAIDSGLTDPNLKSADVAASAGISVRYANKLLAEQRQSLGRLILATRLQRCRRALEDPLQANRSISDIAYAWGFSDMTHFGRSFRKAYGMLPSDYRRARYRGE